MKIAVVGTRGFPGIQGGVEKHCEELYPRLSALGCDVTVFTRTPYVPKHLRHSEWKDVHLIHLWSPKKKAIEAFYHTLRGVLYTRHMRPDIVHVHAIGPSLLMPLIKLFGSKIVMTHHGPDYEREKWGAIAKFALRHGERIAAFKSDRIISISQGIKDLIKSKYGVDSVLIPNGVSVSPHVSSGNILSRFGLQPGKYVLSVCRFVPEKGILTLVNAYMRLADPPFKLVIAGDADHETAYSRKIKAIAGDHKNIVLTGFIEGVQLSELFSSAGLFVLPSFHEGLPIVLLEALSYGLPVLVSDIPQHREISLVHSRYFPAGNTGKLADALFASFRQGISRVEAEENMSLIKREYNWDVIAEKTYRLYQALLENE